MLVQWYFPQREKSTRLGISVPIKDPPNHPMDWDRYAQPPGQEPAGSAGPFHPGAPWVWPEALVRQAKSIQGRHGLGRRCPGAPWGDGLVSRSKPMGRLGGSSVWIEIPGQQATQMEGRQGFWSWIRLRSLFQRVLHIIASFSLVCSKNCVLRNISISRNSRDENIVLINLKGNVDDK